jgi:hypothetical protein
MSSCTSPKPHALRFVNPLRSGQRVHDVPRPPDEARRCAPHAVRLGHVDSRGHVRRRFRHAPGALRNADSQRTDASDAHRVHCWCRRRRSRRRRRGRLDHHRRAHEPDGFRQRAAWWSDAASHRSDADPLPLRRRLRWQRARSSCQARRDNECAGGEHRSGGPERRGALLRARHERLLCRLFRRRRSRDDQLAGGGAGHDGGGRDVEHRQRLERLRARADRSARVLHARHQLDGHREAAGQRVGA